MNRRPAAAQYSRGEWMSLTEPASNPNSQPIRIPKWVAVVGAGSGGPQALAQVLPQLPPELAGVVVVVQQIRPGFTRVLVDILQPACQLPIHEADDGQALLPSRIYVVPANSSLTFENQGADPSENYRLLLEPIADSRELATTRIDAAMISAARIFGNKCVGVLLTGLGTDGCEGMRSIRDAGGLTIAQDQASSVVHGLPASAIEAGLVHEVLPLWSIADHIAGLKEGANNAVAV